MVLDTASWSDDDRRLPVAFAPEHPPNAAAPKGVTRHFVVGLPLCPAAFLRRSCIRFSLPLLASDGHPFSGCTTGGDACPTNFVAGGAPGRGQHQFYF